MTSPYDHPSREDYVRVQRKRVAQIAAEMLSGVMLMVEGSRFLASLRHEVDVPEDDPDFLAFVTIDSETDELPVGSERRLWSQEALAREAADIGRAEEFARKVGAEACRNLVRRFGAA